MASTYTILELRTPEDEADMLGLLRRLGQQAAVVDLEESMALESVRKSTRLWRQADGALLAFAYVDDYSNLWFEMAPGTESQELDDEIVAWGVECIAMRPSTPGSSRTLDTVCRADSLRRIELLERHGFTRTGQRTMTYTRSLDTLIDPAPLPEGFSMRHARGEEEAAILTELHRAAFGTDNMTVERRVAIMRASSYEAELDLLVVAPDGELAAFCICMIDREENERLGREDGHPDPIGVRPKYRHLGLGRAVLTAGLLALQARGMKRAVLGTSSDNAAMQRLAESVGFRVEEERLWFAREIGC